MEIKDLKEIEKLLAEYHKYLDNNTKALRYIKIYLNDYCNNFAIKNNNVVHPRFVKEMLISIRDLLVI